MVAVLFSITVTAVLLYFRDSLGHMGDWGYLGVLLIQLVNNATIVFPAFGLAFIVALADTFNPFMMGLVGGVGAALGETTGYLVGMSGRHALEGGGLRYRRLNALAQRWGGATIFVFALTPLPFDLAGIWAGSVRYSFWTFLLLTGAGKVVQLTALGLAAFYSISWIERAF
jgi:membrane protein DedA with SNARE-associated domain